MSALLTPEMEEAADLAPLSFAQQRLWFLDQMQPGSPRYNVPTAFRLRGRLNPAALEESLRMIIGRHEILRTVYVQGQDEPMQKILEEAPFTLSVENVTEAELPARLRAAAVKPFDLAHDLMLRATLFRLGEMDHVLFLNAHHIAFDEWSLQTLWRELAAGYEGRAATLEELPIQYADYAAWQREDAVNWEASEKFWRERLRDPASLDLAENFTVIPGETGARECLTLTPELTAALRALARREGVTMHVTLLAGFQILLHRWSAQEDIIVGVPVAGRTHFQTEPLLGFFVNTLPVRVSLGGQPSFRELLQRARLANLEACEHQAYPFEQIVEAVRAARRPNRNPLFEVVFSTQQGEAAWDWPGLQVEPIEVETATAKFDLTLVAQDRGERTHLIMEYRADSFRAPTIRQMLGHYQATLEAMAAQPDAPVASLPLLTEKGRSLPVAPTPPAPRSAPEAEPPQTRLQRRLREIWEQALGHKDFGSTDNFFEIGGHSLLAVKLIAQVEKNLGRRLPLPILFRAPTIEKMAEALMESATPTLGSCLVEIQPRGSRPPIFWLHTLGGGGGGGLFTYRKLAEALGTDQPSYGFVAPAQPFDSIEAMAARYVAEMKALQPAGPYRIGGYCFGGVVAYEMARQLEAQGEETAVLALLDSSPPDPRGERKRPSLQLAWHALTALPGWLAKMDRETVKRILQRVREGVARRLQRASTPAPADGAARLEDFVDMTHYPADYRRFATSHWKALMNYTPGAYRGRATLFKTDERHLFQLEAVDAWRKLIPNLEIRRVTGKHEQILDHPHAEKLAAQLQELLNTAA
ncbi:MAG TPA: condensation domain-containing protein [Verrucomicrobiae bacterium]|jgi:thioesterase domain-containing protein|nr:condensation domain-containing protein [Verrucomicrobiae bacterium]